MIYALTPEQHAQIVEALEDAYSGSILRFDETMAMLKGLKPVEPSAWVLLRRDDDGLEPVMFYGGKDKPEGEFKDRFELRAAYTLEAK